MSRIDPSMDRSDITHGAPPPQKPSKRRGKAPIVLGAVLLALGSCGVGSAIGGGTETETVTKTVTKEVPVPGPTITSERPVEIPVTPDSCVTAIGELTNLLALQGEALDIASDMIGGDYSGDERLAEIAEEINSDAAIANGTECLASSPDAV